MKVGMVRCGASGGRGVGRGVGWGAGRGLAAVVWLWVWPLGLALSLALGVAGVSMVWRGYGEALGGGGWFGWVSLASRHAAAETGRFWGDVVKWRGGRVELGGPRGWPSGARRRRGLAE